MVDPARYRQLFAAGAREQLQALGEALTAAGPPDLGALRRAWHSLKGMSATMGFEDLARQAHAAEEALRGQPPLPASAFELSARTARAFEAALLASEPPPPTTPTLGEEISDRSHLPASVSVPAEDLMALAHQLAELRALLPSPMHRRLGRLQDGVQRLLLLPAGALVPGLRVALAEAARQLGREVQLTFEGEDLRLGRATLELLAVPLQHLLRNAAAHGIELPAQRGERGKPVQGRIRVTFRVDGTMAQVSVEDDGAGVPLERLHDALGAHSPGLAALSVERLDLAPFLCRPGLSTSTRLSETAGRGIGLDAVQVAMHRHGGRLSLTTEPGRGTRVTLEAPLSLHVTPCLLARRDGVLYAVPMGAAERIPTRAEGEPRDEPSLMLRAADGTVTGLGVDELLGRLDAVFQPLPPGFDAGGTFLGVALTRQGEPVLLLRPGHHLPGPRAPARSL